MSNGFNYESPLNAFLSRGLPQMVSDIANREARKKALEKELEWKEDEAEKSRIFSAEQSRLSRESNEKWREESRQDQLRRDLDNTERQNRRERVNRTVRDEQNDKEMIISLSDSSLPTIQNWANTNVMRTDIGEDRLSALLGRKKQNATYMTNVAKDVPFSDSYKKALMQSAKLGNIDRFDSLLTRGLASFQKTSGMGGAEFEEWKALLETKKNLEFQDSLNTGMKKDDVKLRKQIRESIDRVIVDMGKLRGVTIDTKALNLKEKKVMKTLSERFKMSEEELQAQGIDGVYAAFDAEADRRGGLSKLSDVELIEIAKTFKYGDTTGDKIGKIWDELFADKEPKQKKEEYPPHEKTYRSLINKSRTKSNVNRLIQLEKQYPYLKELGLR